MYADPKKYLEREPENRWFIEEYLPDKNIKNDNELIKYAIHECNGEIIEGRWYWVGIRNFISLCEKYYIKYG